jgi:hypothetical protein
MFIVRMMSDLDLWSARCYMLCSWLVLVSLLGAWLLGCYCARGCWPLFAAVVLHTHGGGAA